MAAPLLKLTLMIAVAISQAIGGVSCCCLSRAFSESITSFKGETARSCDLASLPESRPACPKCSARKPSGSSYKAEIVSKTKPGDVRFEKEQRCRCAKLEIRSSAPGEPFSVERVSQIAFGIICVVEPVLCIELLRLPDFNVPVRFGGNSWQSFACVWRN